MSEGGLGFQRNLSSSAGLGAPARVHSLKATETWTSGLIEENAAISSGVTPEVVNFAVRQVHEGAFPHPEFLWCDQFQPRGAAEALGDFAGELESAGVEASDEQDCQAAGLTEAAKKERAG